MPAASWRNTEICSLDCCWLASARTSCTTRTVLTADRCRAFPERVMLILLVALMMESPFQAMKSEAATTKLFHMYLGSSTRMPSIKASSPL
jgi:hypothetical protein